MAAITSATSGLSTATTTWVGGVVPVQGDKVTIALGHTVTLSSTHTWGDDTITGITVNGILKASRTVNSSLTCYGELVISAGGEFDFGKTTAGSGVNDQIPLGITATLILNQSLTMAICKYGITTFATSKFFVAGATRVPVARLTAAVAISATSIQVDQVVGWNVGDTLYITATSSASYVPSVVTINGAITGSAGAYIVPVTAVPKAHLAGGGVGNGTSNVTFTSFSASFPGYQWHICNTTTPLLQHDYSYAVFKNIGQTANATSQKNSTFGLNCSNSIVYGVSPVNIKGMTFDNFGNTLGTGLQTFSFRPRAILTDCFTVASANQTCSYFGGGVTADFVNCGFTYGSANVSSNSQGGQACRWIGGWFIGVNSTSLSNSVSISPYYYRVTIGNSARLANMGAVPGCIFEECDLGVTIPFVQSYLLSGGLEASFNVTFKNCQMPPAMKAFDIAVLASKIQESSNGSEVNVINRNADPLVQEKWIKTGVIYRDNAQLFSNSRSSIRFEPIVANTPHAYSYYVAASAGVPSAFRFGLRYDTTYGVTNPPTVTVSGLGITPQVFTAGGSVNTDYYQSLFVTPVTSGELTITVSGQSPSVLGKFWVSGFFVAPYVDWIYQYGYKYNPSSTIQTIDTVVQLSESAAGALSGISYSAGTLSISGALFIREVYDWLKWYETQNRIEPIITGTDGINFILSSNLTITGSLTGSGSLTVNTLTISGSSSLPITHSAGIYQLIKISNIIPNSRVQVVNTTSNAELYNDIVLSSTLSLTSNWSTDYAVRVRATHYSPLLSHLPYQSTGTFTSSGFSTQLNQELDTTYNTNAIDGATCTEFTANFTNVLVDVTDPDGITSIQRLYAFYVYATNLPSGISGYYGAVVAEDLFNYRINADVVNLKIKNLSTQPVIIEGARLYRSDNLSVFIAGNGPIQLEPSKAYLAASSQLNEIHGRLGLSKGIAMVTSPTQISFGSTVIQMEEINNSVISTRL
jgi:hypothetical protein